MNEGEYLCKKCNGAGLVPRSNINFNGPVLNRKKITLICSECLGEGKLDWIEKATGKNTQNITLETEKKMITKKGRQLKGVFVIGLTICRKLPTST